MNPGSISCFLKIHLEIYKVNNNLNMSLGLHITTHNAKTDPWLFVFGNKCRDYCMKWPFTRSIHIVMTFFETEHFSPVLQDKTQSGRAHTRSHSPVVALNKRNHITI